MVDFAGSRGYRAIVWVERITNWALEEGGTPWIEVEAIEDGPWIVGQPIGEFLISTLQGKHTTHPGEHDYSGSAGKMEDKVHK